MKKSKWLDCQGNEFFPKLKGTPSLVKIEHKNTATLDSARSKKKYKVAVLQLVHRGTAIFFYPTPLFKFKNNDRKRLALRILAYLPYSTFQICNFRKYDISQNRKIIIITGKLMHFLDILCLDFVAKGR